MSTSAKNTRSNVIPAVMYREAGAAIEWLANTFGFEKHLVVPGENGAIVHAELRLGNGMIMCGAANDRPYGRLMKQPGQIGGYTTQGIYVVVNDADTVYARAKAAGAEIVIDITTQDYGGRDFTCRDLEGHLWTFGTYDPWEARSD